MDRRRRRGVGSTFAVSSSGVLQGLRIVPFRDEIGAVPRPLPLTRGGALDALRFLAAFCMVVHHYAVDAPIALAERFPAVERGYLATDFFIVVSGYVLGRIYGERVVGGQVSAFDFFLRRAGRVVPAHLMVAAAFVALVLLAGAAGARPTNPEWFDWRELPGQVALIQAWGPFGGKGWNAPVWSLSALLGCYLAFPWLWRALRRIPSPVLALLIGLGGLAAADALTQAVFAYPVYQMPMSLGGVRALPLFVLGVCLAVCSETLYIPPKLAAGVGAAALALFASLLAIGRHDYLSLCLIALVVLAAGAMPAERPSKVLEKGALASFALFITNELVRVAYFGFAEVAAGRLGLGEPARWALWWAALPTAVLCAVAFHYLIDWPSQAWVKARLPKLRAAAGKAFARPLPAPDPNFDLARAGRRARVHEVALSAGPILGGGRRGIGPHALYWG